MERGPLLQILTDMKGTDKELDLIIMGHAEPKQIVNVVDAEELRSSHGIKITTMQNYIWVDASHVSMAYQARVDIQGEIPGMDFDEEPRVKRPATKGGPKGR